MNKYQQSILANNRFGYGAKLGDSASTFYKDPTEKLTSQLSSIHFKDKGTDASTKMLLLYGKFKYAKFDSEEFKNNPSRANKKLLEAKNKLEQESNLMSLNLVSRSIKSDSSIQYRLLDFFSNHFSVSSNDALMKALAPTLEREAIAPYLTSQFQDMLIAVITHPAMLVYLNNDVSIGPNSKSAKKTGRGLNENLAREILELHTLGVNGGYTQKDIIELAKAISGWGVEVNNKTQLGFHYRKYAHQPEAITVLGTHYPDTQINQGKQVLARLANHPSTALNICNKLARHFISDNPDQDLVKAMQQKWIKSEGNIKLVMSTMIEHSASWNPDVVKHKSPRDYLISSYRALGLPTKNKPLLKTLTDLGQPVFGSNTPKGYADNSNEWLTASSMTARIQWSNIITQNIDTSAQMIAKNALGYQLSKHTLSLIKSAPDNQTGLRLFLMSPEFQMR